MTKDFKVRWFNILVLLVVMGVPLWMLFKWWPKVQDFYSIVRAWFPSPVRAHFPKDLITAVLLFIIVVLVPVFLSGVPTFLWKRLKSFVGLAECSSRRQTACRVVGDRRALARLAIRNDFDFLENSVGLRSVVPRPEGRWRQVTTAYCPPREGYLSPTRGKKWQLVVGDVGVGKSIFVLVSLYRLLPPKLLTGKLWSLFSLWRWMTQRPRPLRQIVVLNVAAPERWVEDCWESVDQKGTAVVLDGARRIDDTDEVFVERIRHLARLIGGLSKADGPVILTMRKEDENLLKQTKIDNIVQWLNQAERREIEILGDEETKEMLRRYVGERDHNNQHGELIERAAIAAGGNPYLALETFLFSGECDRCCNPKSDFVDFFATHLVTRYALDDGSIDPGLVFCLSLFSGRPYPVDPEFLGQVWSKVGGQKEHLESFSQLMLEEVEGELALGEHRRRTVRDLFDRKSSHGAVQKLRSAKGRFSTEQILAALLKEQLMVWEKGSSAVALGCASFSDLCLDQLTEWLKNATSPRPDTAVVVRCHDLWVDVAHRCRATQDFEGTIAALKRAHGLRKLTPHSFTDDETRPLNHELLALMRRTRGRLSQRRWNEDEIMEVRAVWAGLLGDQPVSAFSAKGRPDLADLTEFGVFLDYTSEYPHNEAKDFFTEVANSLSNATPARIGSRGGSPVRTFLAIAGFFKHRADEAWKRSERVQWKDDITLALKYLSQAAKFVKMPNDQITPETRRDDLAGLCRVRADFYSDEAPRQESPKNRETYDLRALAWAHLCVRRFPDHPRSWITWARTVEKVGRFVIPPARWFEDEDRPRLPLVISLEAYHEAYRRGMEMGAVRNAAVAACSRARLLRRIHAAISNDDQAASDQIEVLLGDQIEVLLGLAERQLDPRQKLRVLVELAHLNLVLALTRTTNWKDLAEACIKSLKQADELTRTKSIANPLLQLRWAEALFFLGYTNSDPPRYEKRFRARVRAAVRQGARPKEVTNLMEDVRYWKPPLAQSSWETLMGCRLAEPEYLAYCQLLLNCDRLNDAPTALTVYRAIRAAPDFEAAEAWFAGQRRLFNWLIEAAVGHQDWDLVEPMLSCFPFAQNQPNAWVYRNTQVTAIAASYPRISAYLMLAEARWSETPPANALGNNVLGSLPQGSVGQLLRHWDPSNPPTEGTLRLATTAIVKGGNWLSEILVLSVLDALRLWDPERARSLAEKLQAANTAIRSPEYQLTLAMIMSSVNIGRE